MPKFYVIIARKNICSRIFVDRQYKRHYTAQKWIIRQAKVKQTIGRNCKNANYGTFAPKNFRSQERKYHGMELSLSDFLTFGHRRRLHRGDRPHGQKVVGGDALKFPTQEF